MCFIRAARVDALREGVVEGFDEYEKLRVSVEKILLRHSIERTCLVDRMYDGPAQMKEIKFVAFEWELVEIAQPLAFDRLELHDDELCLDVDQLISPFVSDSEHEAGNVLI